MVSTRTMAAASEEAAAGSPSPSARWRRGRPPKMPQPAAEAPRSPSPISPLLAAAKDAAEGYEKEREERIRENRERMQKLGILDLALRLNHAPSAASNAHHRRSSPYCAGLVREKPVSATPARRSLRLQSATPVSYNETCNKKEKDLDIGSLVLINGASKEEFYTEEHEKLLGTCEMPWTLFVDGVGPDGKRIYDQIRGKSCHQCRQKTLGHRTRCSKCQLTQGQFCGDCLYMRYGENVLEAKKNPNWTCPVCRGICNCSLCRTKKGWYPTGNMYRKVVSLGYKSVAQYLIHTRRSPASSEDLILAASLDKLPSGSKSATLSISENALEVDQSENAEMSSNISSDERSELLGNGSDESRNVSMSKPQGKDSHDCKDESRSKYVVTGGASDCEADQDVGCSTPVKQESKKRKSIERNTDCIARRLRSQYEKL